MPVKDLEGLVRGERVGYVRGMRWGGGGDVCDDGSGGDGGEGVCGAEGGGDGAVSG